eukprot:1159733-Pelagomonas_calceolata.AAC.3
MLAWMRPLNRGCRSRCPSRHHIPDTGGKTCRSSTNVWLCSCSPGCSHCIWAAGANAHHAIMRLKHIAIACSSECDMMVFVRPMPITPSCASSTSQLPAAASPA